MTILNMTKWSDLMSTIDYMVLLDGLPLMEYVLLKGYKPDEDWQCLNFTQEHILLNINEAPYLSMSEVAQSMGLDKRQFSHTVKKLVSDGFVIQHRDSEDRRKVYLEMTDKGLEYSDKVKVKLNLHINEVFKDLPVEDKNALIDAALTFKSVASKILSKCK